MYILRFICLTIASLVMQVWRLPKTISIALQQKRQQTTRREFEIERLDRIRNPSKYLGK